MRKGLQATGFAVVIGVFAVFFAWPVCKGHLMAASSPQLRTLGDEERILICSKQGKQEKNDDLKKVEKSYEVWKKLAKKSKGNYHYTVRHHSMVSIAETKIVVEKNKVVKRSFKNESFDHGAGKVKLSGRWEEKGEKVGTNKNGAKALTIDQLYKQAMKIAKEKDLPGYKRRIVLVGRDGLLKMCRIIDARIADGPAGGGVQIAEIGLPVPRAYRSPSGKNFPIHWGAPPSIETRDLRELPGDYGMGSGTMKRWIEENMKKDKKKKKN